MTPRQKYYAFSKPLGELYRISGPVHIYQKDTSGNYINCNPLMAYQAGISPSKIVGKTDYDLRWDVYADNICQNDSMVLNQRSTHIFFEPCTTIENIPFEVISIKTPCQDNTGNIVGVFGMSFYLNHLCFFNILPHFLQNQGNKKATFSLTTLSQQTIEGKKLTRRETMCLYYLFRGMTAKEIARKMNLSPRTVEQYLKQTREKYNCHKRSDLISKAINDGFPFQELSQYL